MDEKLNKELKELELTKMNEKAEDVLACAVAATSATGAIPIPFADAPLLIGEQVALLAKISSIYGIKIKEDGLKMLCTAALGVGGATVVGKTIVSNIFKLIPGIGTVAGSVISGGTAGLLTLAMGKSYIEVCKMVKHGDLSESDLVSEKGKTLMKENFKKQIKKHGKDNNMQRDQKDEIIDEIKYSVEVYYDDNSNNNWKESGTVIDESGREYLIEPYKKIALDRTRFDLNIDKKAIKSIELTINVREKMVYSVINGELNDQFEMY